MRGDRIGKGRPGRRRAESVASSRHLFEDSFSDGCRFDNRPQILGSDMASAFRRTRYFKEFWDDLCKRAEAIGRERKRSQVKRQSAASSKASSELRPLIRREPQASR